MKQWLYSSFSGDHSMGAFESAASRGSSNQKPYERPLLHVSQAKSLRAARSRDIVEVGSSIDYNPFKCQHYFVCGTQTGRKKRKMMKGKKEINVRARKPTNCVKWSGHYQSWFVPACDREWLPCDPNSHRRECRRKNNTTPTLSRRHRGFFLISGPSLLPPGQEGSNEDTLRGSGFVDQGRSRGQDTNKQKYLTLPSGFRQP